LADKNAKDTVKIRKDYRKSPEYIDIFNKLDPKSQEVLLKRQEKAENSSAWKVDQHGQWGKYH